MAAKDIKTRMKEITDELEQGVKNVFSSGQYAKYLRTMSQFHHYSFRNSLLIHLQRPNATRVAGFNTWKNKFGRYVNKGEKGIHILAPTPYKKHIEVSHDKQGKPLLDENGQPTTKTKEITIPAFKPVFVFDVSQTSGRELPTIASELTGSVEEYELLFNSLKKVSPYPIEFEKIGGNTKKGYCDFTNQRIAIKLGMAEAHSVKTAIHEITHARLHNIVDPTQMGDRESKEIEAESTAFVVCNHYGIDTSDYSFGYVASWSADQDLNKLQKSLETIQKAASELINDIDGQMQELKQIKEQEQSPVFQLISEYEQKSPVFGQEEKEILIRYAEYQGNFDKVALLANELADLKFELKHGHVNIDVKSRIDTFCKQVDKFTPTHDSSTPPVPIRIDAPFIPPVELISYNPYPEKNGNFKFQVAENEKVFGTDGKEDGLFPIQTVNLDSKEYTLVGFNRLREYTFETTAYYDCLFENDAVNIDTMLHIPDHPGLWKCVDKITLREDTYFAVADYSKEISNKFMVLNQNGKVFIEQAFKDIECNWEHSDLRDAVSSTLANQAIEISNRTEHPMKPSIGDKIIKAQQSIKQQSTVRHTSAKRAICAGMER